MYQVLSVSIDRNSNQLNSLVNAFIHVFNKHLLKIRHGARLQNYYNEQDSDSAIVVVQSLRCTRHFATPWTAACQAPLSSTVSWSLLKFMSIELVMLFNHLILHHPFSFCLQSFPGMGSLPELALRITWPKYWSFSFSISPSNEYSGLISFRNDWFDLLAVQGTLKSFLQPFLPLSLAGDDI